MIVSELSRLGRSVSEVIRLTGEIIQKGIKIICVKENITFDQSSEITSEIMRTMFGLFAQMERYLISERTKVALQAAKDKGKQLGAGGLEKGPSKLDPYKVEIQALLRNGSTKVFIATRYDSSVANLYHWFNPDISSA